MLQLWNLLERSTREMQVVRIDGNTIDNCKYHGAVWLLSANGYTPCIIHRHLNDLSTIIPMYTC